MNYSTSIRNFSIISHIDHGKSTLADRFLEITDTVSKRKLTPQFLDRMDLEKEKGITIKMKPVRMKYKLGNEFYHLNLIDTPGHVDFSYEVSRSLAAVEGAVLLVDATKGIQAQTLANLELAKNQNLVIIPVVNKIDLPQARIEETKKELTDLLEIEEEKVLEISAKEGTNVNALLERIIKEVPPPTEGNLEKPLRALIFDSEYDSFKGVVAFVRVVDGEIKDGEEIKLCATNTTSKLKEIGFFVPDFLPQKKISAGEIGYIATGIKTPGKVRVGDTITVSRAQVEPLAGYKNPVPMVFTSFYTENPDNFDILKEGLEKLKLNDPSLTFTPESKRFLGRGFRCGFLGTLHVEIVSRRLSREYGLNLIISTPSVVYRIIDKRDKEKFVYSASDWPHPTEIKKIEEPWVLLEIITPTKYMGKCLEVLEELSGSYIDTKYLREDRVILIYETPLREIIINLYEKIKNATQGYASMNYKKIGFREADLVKLEILIAGEPEESFAKIVPRNRAYLEGKALVGKLKDTLPPQQFKVPLQAAVEGKIIARETLTARRKDVTAPLYGGDVTRKRKLLEKQRKGKRELEQKGQLRIPSDVFLKIFKGY